MSRELPTGTLEGYQNFMISKIAEKSAEEVKNWAQKQCYIGLGNILNTAAELKIDATPMEGFSASDVTLALQNESLKGFTVCLGIALGYRHKEDATSAYKKVRKPLSEIVVTL
ncbi:MAG: hypothetical protein C4K58_04220 [Flavobacteriaceae bacterium]|nr:MAG: hypothetical protein C4K58_04220 [Flavobacteriaceae bacterium]